LPGRVKSRPVQKPVKRARIQRERWRGDGDTDCRAATPVTTKAAKGAPAKTTAGFSQSIPLYDAEFLHNIEGERRSPTENEKKKPRRRREDP